MRPKGGLSSSGTQNMQSSTGQYSTQAGEPAQPVQHSVMTASSFGFFLRGVVIPSDLGSLLITVAVMTGLWHIRRLLGQIVDSSQRLIERLSRLRTLHSHYLDRSRSCRTPAGEHARRWKSGEHGHQGDSAGRGYMLSGGIVADIQNAARDLRREWRECALPAVDALG